MAEADKEQAHVIQNFEGMQLKTSRFLKKKGELWLLQSGLVSEVGAVQKRKGYIQKDNPLTSSTSTSTSTTTTSTSTSTTSTSTT